MHRQPTAALLFFLWLLGAAAFDLEVTLGDSCRETEKMANTGGNYGSIPLKEFRKDIPPGWGPNIDGYPLREYFDALKLWYRLYEGPDEFVGPLLVGRLQDNAKKLGSKLKLIRPDGQYDVGDAALVRLSVDEVRDPGNPAMILQERIPSGVQALCNKLKEAYGVQEHDRATASLDQFFDHRRGKQSLAEDSVHSLRTSTRMPARLPAW